MHGDVPAIANERMSGICANLFKQCIFNSRTSQVLQLLFLDKVNNETQRVSYKTNS